MSAVSLGVIGDEMTRKYLRFDSISFFRFRPIVFLIGWMLWKQRNARTFDGSTRTARELAVDIRLVAEDWRMAGYRQLGILLSGR